MSRFKDGKGGGKGKFKVPPQSKAIRRKRRSPQLFANFDRSPTDLGIDAVVLSNSGSQTYTVPKGVDTVTVKLYGAGGGGGNSFAGKAGLVEGGGGGGGGRVVITVAEVTPGTVLTFNIGAGGAAATSGQHGSDGGDTTFTTGGVLYTAGGGEGAKSGGTIIGAIKDGSGGVSTRASGSAGTLTNGNDGDNTNLDGTGGAGLDASNANKSVGGTGQLSGSADTAGAVGFVEIT